MFVECIDNAGFEDKLTNGIDYKIKERGENSFLVDTEDGKEHWFGKGHFSDPKCLCGSGC